MTVRPVFADHVVCLSTGYRPTELWAVRVDGEGDVLETHVEWTVKKGVPVKSSPILFDG